MRTYILAAGLAAAAFTTTQANAATVCRQDSSGRTVATIAGVGVGAILGRVITGQHGGTAGALVGGALGGVAANQLAKDDTPRCDRAYGYYDENYRWHANAQAANAEGYYDRDGNWVSGTPNGYYDRNNRWVAFNGDPAAAGYRDRDGRWVPIGASGYYAADGQWVSASAPGYYDSRGRWVAGPASGHYNANGVWVADTNRYGEPSGSWAYQTQPGYYDNGRWVRGETTGYYDSRGRWVSSGPATAMSANYSQTYAPHRMSVADRATRIQNRIVANRKKGLISRREADNATAELSSIRRQDYRLRRNGVLGERDSQMLQERLDRVAQMVRMERDDNDNRPG